VKRRPLAIIYRVLEVAVMAVTYLVLGFMVYRAITWLF
jgi:hypothetical protein